jgi:flagellar basal-body rod protein FlgF
MDRLIYLAMTGAKHLLMRQESLAQNLANANTSGFRAQQVAFRTAPVVGVGAPTRAFAVDTTPSADFSPGVIAHTGRELDVAVGSRGWIAVQGRDGREGYTRAGSLQLDTNGTLVFAGGLPVLGEGGPIIAPPDSRLTIAADGTVSATPMQPPLSSATTLGRIKLVDPPEGDLMRDADGLFRLRSGRPAEADTKVRLVSGAVEGSNVNVAETMVGMIAAARQFEMQMRMLTVAEADARAADRLLSTT